jgi:subtilisin family serine protease
MKKFNFVVLSLAMAVVFHGCVNEEFAPVDELNVPFEVNNASVKDKYIVVLHDDEDVKKMNLEDRKESVRGRAAGLLKKNGVNQGIEDIYETALQGFTARMSERQMKKLLEDPAIKRIEPDRIITLAKPTKPSPDPPAQTTPWGITRVRGGASGAGKVAWVIDSGIDLKHPDLHVDEGRSRQFISNLPRVTPNDENGHGTHVAGTIAAKNNDIGVIGVAADATVVSVRVLDRSGSGTLSGVINGVNYVAANGVAGEVANMSLGGGISTSLDEAVLNASANVKFVLAAGNSSKDVSTTSPARVNGPNVYTISAMGENDIWASFSNFGAGVDYCAPGVRVYSTYKDGGYNTLSGTSMAAPHVAGILLLGNICIEKDNEDKVISVIGDPDGKPDPIAVVCK